MNCSVCFDLKIVCNDCKGLFHYKCVNIVEEDEDNMKTSLVPFRCDECSVLRWRSVHLAGSFENINKHASTSSKKTNSHQSSAATTKEEEQFLQSIRMLQEENTELKSKIQTLESRLNWQQQSSLKNCIEIAGLAEVDNSNAISAVLQLFRDVLAVEVTHGDIDNCYVKKVQTSGGKENVLSHSLPIKSIVCVEFSNFALKQRIMREKMKKKTSMNTSYLDRSGRRSSSKGCDVYINDAFTKYTKALFMQAKEVKEQKGYNCVWYKENKILVRKVEGGNVTVIRSFNDLVKI